MIAYVDRIPGGGIGEISALLQGPPGGRFGGVHLLPFFYPIDGADAGFDPIDHTRVDPRLGTWEDLQALGGLVELTATSRCGAKRRNSRTGFSRWTACFRTARIVVGLSAGGPARFAVESAAAGAARF